VKNLINVLLVGFFASVPATFFAQNQSPPPPVVHPAFPTPEYFAPEIPGEVMPAYPILPQEPQPQPDAPINRPSLRWLVFPRYLVPPGKSFRGTVLQEALAERRGFFMYA